ncbi:MAG: tetratricopeptide repeat protein [bacterium]|nr:tetratricopeptide repeat protein [bacterium]
MTSYRNETNTAASQLGRLEALLEHGSVADRANTRIELASVLSASDAQRAREYAREALELATASGDDSIVALAHRVLAYTAWACGSHEVALEHAARALRGFEQLGDLTARARTHLIVAMVLTTQSHIAGAVEEVLTAHRLSAKSGDRQGEAIALNNLGLLYARLGQYERALRYRLECAQIHEQIGDRYRFAIALNNIGEMHRALGRPEQALGFNEKALELLEKIEPDGFPIAGTYRSLGEMRCADGELDAALELFSKALEVNESSGDESGVAGSCIAIGNLHHQRGEPEVAERYLRKALECAARIGARQEERAAHAALARVLRERGAAEEALRSLDRVLELQELMFDEQQSRVIEEMRAKYDAERKEREAEIYQLKFVQLEEETKRREHAEKTLLQAQKLESLGLLAGGVAHDFNNMLTAVLGHMSLAADTLEQDHVARSYLERAHESGRRAAGLAQQMLAYAGRRQYEMDTFELNAIIDRARTLLTGVVDSNVELRFVLEPGLPPIRAEETQIHQVLMNLVLNAVEAGASSIEIRTSCDPRGANEILPWTELGQELEPGGYVCMTIADDGQGMSDDVRMRAFDPFYSTKFVGRGLGLAAVLGITRSHGGGVRVKSEVGQGSTFEFLLPVQGASSEGAAHRAEECTGPGRQRSGGVVLVVDDEPLVVEVVSSMLQGAGIEVLTASEGGRAVEIFQEHGTEIDVVLLDMTMPGLGIEATWRALRAHDPSVAILFTSGYERERALGILPANADFIQKPYDAGRLIEALAPHLG